MAKTFDTRPNTPRFTTVELGTVLEPRDPAPIHSWPTVTGKPDQIVTYEGERVGQCGADGVAVFDDSGGREPQPCDIARRKVQLGELTSIDSEGNLI
ncbi:MULTISPECIES: hypothetical protein [unclassified Ruegeria]|uniref:hypothetical protein n=1 Tax=unclassified Ruegeria TaxID=2625375 RepID=UPI0014912603|nr:MULTISPECIES: hypothetical protein [unclassified Ruegeria]NOD87897.1 hypothetical protein [Ruegeria sp. HKCCD4318]NOE14267.1 hypothetical protein [Ruegeria sp. HKCCD4318-2]NOG08376.1 hypothetical protein [Ruegeria sp. HKCCD4315]